MSMAYKEFREKSGTDTLKVNITTNRGQMYYSELQAEPFRITNNISQNYRQYLLELQNISFKITDNAFKNYRVLPSELQIMLLRITNNII